MSVKSGWELPRMGLRWILFMHRMGEQRFFGDHEKLESFRSDPVVEEAVEQLHQQLEQPNIGIRMGGI